MDHLESDRESNSLNGGACFSIFTENFSGATDIVQKTEELCSCTLLPPNYYLICTSVLAK